MSIASRTGVLSPRSARTSDRPSMLSGAGAPPSSRSVGATSTLLASTAGRVPAATLDGIRARLEALLAGAMERPGAPDRAEVRSVDDELHSAIVAAAGNRQMEAIVRTLRRQTQMFDLRSMPERLEDTCREHLAVVAAIADGQGEAAAAAMRTHLDGVRQSIVQRLARVV